MREAKSFRAAAGAIVILAGGGLSGGTALGLAVQFDYSYDTTGFFADPARRTALANAADGFLGFRDSLSGIAPGGANAWQAGFVHPATGVPMTVADLAVPEKALVVYVGARDMGVGGPLGEGAPGTVAAVAGDGAFMSAVVSRGQGNTSGPGATDFGPWGGTVAFNSALNWIPGSSGGYDLQSVAEHELAHVLGFGVAPSWRRHVVGTSFAGPVSITRYTPGGGTPVPLDPDLMHWKGGTKVSAGDVAFPVLMDRTLGPAERRQLSALDLAGLRDTGWEVAVPVVARGPDLNLDGVINLGDVNVVTRHWLEAGPEGGTPPGDASGDGITNLGDDNYIVARWLNTSEPAGVGGTGLVAVVPEPAGVAIVSGVVVALCRRRRAVRHLSH